MTYNILLFGESGAGKTTTVSALANYLRYADFDEAASAASLGKLENPTKELLDPETNPESPIVVRDGIDSDPNKNRKDKNENSIVESKPEHYDFEFGSDEQKKRIRLIDPPGPAGLDADNFKNILEHLKQFDTLHAICFLLKSTGNKHTVFLGNHLNDLLSQLPRNASKNILFSFTFSSGAGSQFEALKAHLDENELGSAKIDLELGENCFFLDNEPVGYLLELSDYSLTESQTVQYRASWNASRDQTFAMLGKIVNGNFEPIQLELLFKLVNSQKWIQELAQPIEELKAKILDQKESIKEDQRKMNNYNNKNKRNSNAKQIKSTNDRIKAKRQVLREFESELEMIEKFLCTCLRFVVLNANFNCKDLFLPYAELLAKDKSLDSTEQNQNQNQQQPLVRRNSSRGSKRGRKRTNSMPKSPPNEPNNSKITMTSSNQVKIDDIKLLQTKLTQLKHSGKQLRDIFNVGQQTTKDSNISQQNHNSETEQQLKAQFENENDSPISSEKNEESESEMNSNSDLPKPKSNDAESSVDESKVELEQQQNLFEQINELTLKNEQIEKSFDAALEMLESQQSELLLQQNRVENEELGEDLVNDVQKEVVNKVVNEVVNEVENEVVKKEEKPEKYEEAPQLNPIPVIQSPKLEHFISIEEADKPAPAVNNQNENQKQNPISQSIATESIPDHNEPNVPVNPKQELNKNPLQFNNYSTFESKHPINGEAASSSDQIKSSINDVLESVVQSNETEKPKDLNDSETKNSPLNESISGINSKENGSIKSKADDPEISEISKIPEPTENPEFSSTSDNAQTKNPDQEIKIKSTQKSAAKSATSNAPSTTDNKNGKTNSSNGKNQQTSTKKQSKSKNSKPNKKKFKGRSQSSERSSSGCDCPCSIM